MSWLVILGKGNTREEGREVARRHKAQCWGLNDIERYPELTMLWEMHPWPMIQPWNNVRLDTLPVMMQQLYLDVPTGMQYPLKAMEKVYSGLLYANNTLAYMLMLAIAAKLPDGKRRFQNIYLAGVDYRCPDRTELEFEKSCTEYWIGFAIAKGINVYWPEDSNLVTYAGYQHGIRYGYTKGYDTLVDRHRENYGHICAEMLLAEHGKPAQFKDHDHDKFYAEVKKFIKSWNTPGLQLVTSNE